jgi:electron transfer flavoprotein beta subunit
MRSKKAEVLMLTASEIGADPAAVGLKGSTTQVVRVFSPEARGDREILTGSVDEQVAHLMSRLEKIL